MATRKCPSCECTYDLDDRNKIVAVAKHADDPMCLIYVFASACPPDCHPMCVGCLLGMTKDEQAAALSVFVPSTHGDTGSEIAKGVRKDLFGYDPGSRVVGQSKAKRERPQDSPSTTHDAKKRGFKRPVKRRKIMPKAASH